MLVTISQFTSRSTSKWPYVYSFIVIAAKREE